jgi:uncharacterized membrane protein YdjX (TVP38/TMEM64 family)
MGLKIIFTRVFHYLKNLGNIGPLALAMAVLPMLGSAVLITVAYPLGYWLQDNWQIGSGLFLLGTLIFCGLALLPTNLIGILSGWAFSFELGIALLIIGLVGAAFISFLVHSRLTGDRLQHVFDNHPKSKAIHQALLGQSIWRTTLIIFLLRLTPAMPFALTNFLMASARVPVKPFLVGTFFGMLPRSSAVVFVGSGLSDLNFNSPQDSTFVVIGIMATFISVIIIGNVSKRALDKLTQESY